MRPDIKQLLDEGWSLVPLIPGKKNPGDDGWLKRVYTADDFADETNVGAKCGEPSGWRVDVDLDVPEAAKAADALLPDTGLVHGRSGKPRSHRWFVRIPTHRERPFRSKVNANSDRC